jgi:hypothetical protein
MVSMSAAAVFAVVAGLSVHSQAAPLESFEDALAGGRAALFEQQQPQPPQQQPGGVSLPKAWDQFEAPDAQTQTWLTRRIPGLDASKVRVVPPDVADGVMKQAVARGGTYVDLLSDAFFRKPELYYVSAGTLALLDHRYIAGTLQVSGTAEDGQPFQMLGLVLGGGRVHIIYDRGFSYNDEGKRFKIEPQARISATIMGPGDLGLDGISAWGKAVFCPWAHMQRISKESAYKVRVVTQCGARGGLDVKPVRNRAGKFFRLPPP